jgi:hypothetical protein
VSHPLAAWLRATHAQLNPEHGLELMAMVSYALDADGRLRIRSGLVTPNHRYVQGRGL